MEKILEVKDLTISFRTQSGKLQAVRDISFDLNKGETLAIVGESGSGKSVTSKAIMGILAGNSIVENGEILYDGQDLLKINEEDFHKLRGNKISMIFQDPLSSLNPIIRIGKQLTEAMLLKGASRQAECRKTFNKYLADLNNYMVQALSKSEEETKALTVLCQNFDKFEYKHLELEGAYNTAFDAAKNTSEEVKELLFEIEKKVYKDVLRRCSDIITWSMETFNEWVVKGEDQTAVTALVQSIKAGYKEAYKKEEYFSLIIDLTKLKEIMDKVVLFDAPNFFAMGYYLTFENETLPEFNSVQELNHTLREILDKNFMLDFIEKTKEALKFSTEFHKAKKEEAIKVLEEQKKVFEREELVYADCKVALNACKLAVSAAIDPLEFKKDSMAYTFYSAEKSKIAMYFRGVKKNVSEQKKYDRQCAKIDAIIAKGKAPEWKPVPPAIVNLEKTKATIVKIIENLVEHFKQVNVTNESKNYDQLAIDVIDYLKANASGVVDKITRQDAKNTAIRLMEEVGIKDAHTRFNQFPFEFSGGMRQRIVIAIALASNPDILICDEPTTALDVTIQGQILELINKIKKERNLSVIFITHDLGVVANMADRVAVMYAGKIVETGTVEDIFYDPRHPYTWALLSSIPDLDTNERLDAIPGTPPNMIYPPVGDAFAARNKYAMKIDFEAQPPLFKVSDSHYAATWLLHPNAPKVEPPHIVTERIARMKALYQEKEAK